MGRENMTNRPSDRSTHLSTDRGYREASLLRIYQKKEREKKCPKVYVYLKKVKQPIKKSSRDKKLSNVS